MNKKVFISFVTGLYRAVKLGACIFFFFCREICERSVKACTARSNYCRTCILGCSQLLQGRKSLGENTNVEFVIQFLFAFTGVRGLVPHRGLQNYFPTSCSRSGRRRNRAVGDVIRFQRHRFCIFASRGLGDLNGAVRGPLSVRCGQEVQTRPGQCRTFNLQFACSVYLSMHPCTFVWNKLC